MMNPQVLFSKLSGLSPSEKRGESEEFFEAVFFNTGLDKVNAVLEEFLGDPFKPAGVHASAEANAAAKDYGGIHSNQTLYKTEFSGGQVIAMLWPWGNNTHTTLKIVIEKN